MGDKCNERIAVGQCGADVLPGMSVCLGHATKDAMAVQMLRIDAAAREALKLLDYFVVGGVCGTHPLDARKVLRKALT